MTLNLVEWIKDNCFKLLVLISLGKILIAVCGKTEHSGGITWKKQTSCPNRPEWRNDLKQRARGGTATGRCVILQKPQSVSKSNVRDWRRFIPIIRIGIIQNDTKFTANAAAVRLIERCQPWTFGWMAAPSPFYSFRRTGNGVKLKESEVRKSYLNEEKCRRDRLIIQQFKELDVSVLHVMC